MKNILLLFLVFFAGTVFGQKEAMQENIFLTRDYWKGNPTLSDVKTKIEEGHDAVAKSRHSMDATSYAILESVSTDVIEYLLSIPGNDVNKRTHDKRNYVMWAAYKGNKSLVKKLLEMGSDVNITDAHGYNLLTFTALAGVEDTELYDMILDKGVDVKSVNRHGADALLLSCNKSKSGQLISYFEQKGLDIKASDKDGNTAFLYAAKGGNIEMMNELLALGLDDEVTNNNGQNAMSMAAKGGHRQANAIEVFQYLEKLGLKANITAKDGSTPLHGLAGSRDEAVIEYFLGKGVDISAVDDEGNTFFHKAAARNNAKMFKKYARKIKDINLKNKEGKTALFYAIRRKSSPLVTMLLKKGADITIVDKNGSNLVGHLFDSYNPKGALFFHETLDVLKNKGVGVLKKQAEGNSIAHIAIEKLSPQLIQKAVALGADINAQNEDGLTPLQLAAMKAKNPKLLKVLIELGADKNVKSEMGETIFDLASENELLQDSLGKLAFLK